MGNKPLDDEGGAVMDAGRDALVLQVEGMECEGCERRVVNVLRRLEGVRDAMADHVTGRVQVDLTGEEMKPGVLAEHIGRAGYRVIVNESAAEATPVADATAKGDSK